MRRARRWPYARRIETKEKAPRRRAAPFRWRLVVMARCRWRAASRRGSPLGSASRRPFASPGTAPRPCCGAWRADASWYTTVAVTPDIAALQPDLAARRAAEAAGRRRPRHAHAAHIRSHRAGPRASVIGTDVPQITRGHIWAAFRLLGRHDAVFGPAEDGGYWLVGLRRRPRTLRPFAGVRWSTPHALGDTLANLRGRSVARVATRSSTWIPPADFARCAAVSRPPWSRHPCSGTAAVLRIYWTAAEQSCIVLPRLFRRGCRDPMVHAPPQFTPAQLIESGRRAEAEGRLDLAVQFYRHLTEHFAERGGDGRGARRAGPHRHVAAAALHRGRAPCGRPSGRLGGAPASPRDQYRDRPCAWRALFSASGLALALARSRRGAGLLSSCGRRACRSVAGRPVPMAGGAAGACSSGLSVVLAAQIARALFDQASAARDLVALERASWVWIGEEA